VQTGWGRTGTHFWGIEAHDVEPDMIVFAKGLGNGLTIGGVAARAELMDGLPANSISTFGGNHLSTAGALANLRYLLAHDLQGNARRVGKWFLEELAGALAGEPAVGEVRGKGLMIAVECVVPGTTDPAPDTAAAPSLAELQARLQRVEEERGSFLRSLTAADLNQIVSHHGIVVSFSLPLRHLMLHVVNHSTYHRGQLATQFRQLGLTPPNTDFTRYLYEAR
jgi:4-aminobutyrate aminotransferase-like enzyme